MKILQLFAASCCSTFLPFLHRAMPKRWKRGARDDDAPSGTPWPLAVETPAPPSRSRAEQLMQRLWKGELEGDGKMKI